MRGESVRAGYVADFCSREEVGKWMVSCAGVLVVVVSVWYEGIDGLFLFRMRCFIVLMRCRIFKPDIVYTSE